VSRGRSDPIMRAAVPALAGAAAFVLAASALWLWTGYGATVFFETIRVGYTACFG
jgi:hypothetical protein